MEIQVPNSNSKQLHPFNNYYDTKSYVLTKIPVGDRSKDDAIVGTRLSLSS